MIPPSVIASVGRQQARRFFSKCPNSKSCIYMANYDFPDLVKAQLSVIDRRFLATRIGFATNIEERKSAINVGNPLNLHFEPFFCDEPNIFKKYWHAQFCQNRMKGEWFLLEEIDKEMLRVVMQEYQMTGVFLGDRKLFDKIAKCT